MRLPVISGLIERRLLVNFRVEPERVAALLPAPFRPQLVEGAALAGICLIRLGDVRPQFWPTGWGVRSENAAHRIAVEWDDAGSTRRGVYIPRRDTSLWLNALAGGRVFPGVHHLARFRVRENDPEYHVELHSHDGRVHVVVDARRVSELPAGSVFSNVAAAREFFAAGSLGYSPNGSGTCFDGLELACETFEVEPLAVSQSLSSFYANERYFPRGSVRFDSAFLMRNVRHTWHERTGIPAAESEVLCEV